MKQPLWPSPLPSMAAGGTGGWHPDDLPCGWLRAELAGALLESNRPLRALLGWPEASSHQDLPVSLNLLLAPGARVLFQSYLLPLLRLHGRIEEFALEMRHRQGGTVAVLLYGQLDAGQPDNFTLVCVPMQERRRLEEELLRIKRAADLAPGVIFQVVAPANGALHMPYASEGLRNHYRLSPEALRRSLAPWLACLHEDDRGPLLQRFGGTEPHWRLEVRVPQPDGGLQWHEVHAVSRMGGAGPRAWHGYIANVTSRRALEAALRDKAAAEQASQSKSAFLARVSHELRTPLNAILGFTQLLRTQDHERLNAEQQRRLATIATAGQDLLQLINEVLDLSRAEQGQVSVALAPCPLAPALARALNLLEAQAQARGVRLLCEAVPERAWVVADEHRLHEVLVNLLANAVKYNRPGGAVVLVVREEGAAWRIDVTDTGAGLSAEQLAHLFEPFNRLGAESSGIEGAGLGLSIAHRLVQLMGGHLAAESHLGQGSTFSVTLKAGVPAEHSRTPAGAAQVHAPLPTTPAAPGLAAQHEVWQVEDNPVNALLMAALMRHRPEVVLQTLADGQALWSRFSLAGAAAPALLLLDLHLPDGHGLDWLQRLRQLPGGAALRVVVVSASATAEERARAEALGVLDYWLKPLDLSDTLQRLDRQLQR